MSNTYEIGIMAGKEVAKAIDAFFDTKEAKENWRYHEKKVLKDGTSMYRTEMRDHPSMFPVGRGFLDMLRGFESFGGDEYAFRCIMISEEGFKDEVSNTIGQQYFEDFTSSNEINYPDSFEEDEPDYIKKIREKGEYCDEEEASHKMTELLMDTDTKSVDMFESLCHRFVSENSDFQKGMDAALIILLGYNLSEIADMIG
nr:hypothetical protein [uncultured Butyrivibrio sp.]